MTERTLTTLNGADLPPDLVLRLSTGMLAVVSQLVAAFEKALPNMRLVADAVERLEEAPAVPGYQEELRSNEDHPLVAKAMAYQVVRLGEERHKLVEGGRIAASAIWALLHAKEDSDLVVSRRARDLQIALAIPIVKKAFDRACEEAGELNAIYGIEHLLDGLFAQNAGTREVLLTLCEKLKPHLPDPRGRSRTLISATHEIFLEVVGRAFTDNQDAGDFTDPATRATRVAFSDPDFNPRSARRRLRERTARRTN